MKKMISSGAGLIVGIIAYSGYHHLLNKIDNFALKNSKASIRICKYHQRS
jgi:biopolymer transport protein ExbB